jgi:hypothetical protein
MGSTHTLLTPTIIAKEALAILRNNLVMGTKVHRAYEREFNKIGGTVTIRKPVKFKVTTGRTRATSTIVEQSITLTVATQKHVSWAFNSKDLTLTIDQYSKRYIEPAANVLANEIDSDILGLYSDIYNEVWESTGFVDPESFIVLGKAGRKLDEEAAPQMNRCVVLNPAANWSLANAMKNMYVTDVSGPALKKGYLARIANMEVYMDQNVKVHTTGNFHDTGSAAAILVGGTGGTGIPALTNTDPSLTGAQHVPLIDFKVVDTQVLKIGDVFTIAGVFAVNPVSGQSTGQLRQFVVTADASCIATETTGSNTVTAYISPPIIATGPYKTVDTVPATAAAVSIVGTQGEPYPVNIAFHKNAFALVMVPLAVPQGATFAATASEAGFSIRILKGYDIDTDDEIIRMDVLYGVKTLYPELACRIRGAEG